MSRRLFAIKLGVSAALLAVLFARVDAAALWADARTAAPAWLAAALLLYFLNVLASTWRWRLLLDAQGVAVPGRTLLGSYLVAGFFNNFLPSNIGGDVVRIRDTARAAGSKTLATTVVLMDRGIGLMGLVLVAALGATVAAGAAGEDGPVWSSWLWAGFAVGAAAAAPAVLAPSGLAWMLRPLRAFHPEWIGERIERLTNALERFRSRPAALAGCFAGAIVVQALLVGYYLAVASALHLPVRFWDLAVLVPISFVVQMLPLSVNGFGVREATFSFYFARLGLPIASAVLLSLAGAVLMMLFSLTGAIVYVARGRTALDATLGGDQAGFADVR
jgi:uncharacterized membrane protein YbhN (UPF0104 family)